MCNASYGNIVSTIRLCYIFDGIMVSSSRSYLRFEYCLRHANARTEE